MCQLPLTGESGASAQPGCLMNFQYAAARPRSASMCLPAASCSLSVSRTTRSCPVAVGWLRITPEQQGVQVGFQCVPIWFPAGTTNQQGQRGQFSTICKCRRWPGWRVMWRVWLVAWPPYYYLQVWGRCTAWSSGRTGKS